MLERKIVRTTNNNNQNEKQKYGSLETIFVYTNILVFISIIEFMFELFVFRLFLVFFGFYWLISKTATIQIQVEIQTLPHVSIYLFFSAFYFVKSIQCLIYIPIGILVPIFLSVFCFFLLCRLNTAKNRWIQFVWKLFQPHRNTQFTSLKLFNDLMSNFWWMKNDWVRRRIHLFKQHVYFFVIFLLSFLFLKILFFIFHLLVEIVVLLFRCKHTEYTVDKPKNQNSETKKL